MNIHKSILKFFTLVFFLQKLWIFPLYFRLNFGFSIIQSLEFFCKLLKMNEHTYKHTSFQRYILEMIILYLSLVILILNIYDIINLSHYFNIIFNYNYYIFVYFYNNNIFRSLT